MRVLLLTAYAAHSHVHWQRALHEFQGLAVMEAVAHSCLPIVPDRQVYPEIYPDWCRYASHPDDPEHEASAAVSLIVKVAEELARGEVQGPDISAFGMGHLAPLYEQEFRNTMSG